MHIENSFYSLSNNNGLNVEFSSLGGRINSIIIPDEKGFIDIALGYNNIAEMLENDVYIGAICGRFANRISRGKFKISDVEYQLDINNGQNHIHGGLNGFNTKYWKVENFNVENCTSVYKLNYTSLDGEEKYPGKVEISVIYALNDNNELIIEIEAKTDKTTPINITTHPYFNLKGFGNGDILDHLLEINSLEFTPLDSTGVPSGEIIKIEGTVMDFSRKQLISIANNSDYEQIKLAGGIDHNWILNKKQNVMSFAARLSEPKSGRRVEVFTTQPGLQVYTGIHFNGKLGGKNGYLLTKNCGIALEPQNFPDAPNKPNFPNSFLHPDEIYKQKIIYKFIW